MYNHKIIYKIHNVLKAMTDDLKSHIHTDPTLMGPIPNTFRRKEYRLIFIRIMYVDYFPANEDSNIMITYVSNETKHNDTQPQVRNIPRQTHYSL